MRILKFGGTSVADSAAVRRVITLVDGARQRGEVAVVVSAMAGVTDTLLALMEGRTLAAREAVGELRRRHRQCLAELAPHDGLGRRQLEHRLERLRRRLGRVTAEGALPPLREKVLASGEQLSATLLAAALRAAGVAAAAVDARRFIATDSRFGDAEVDLALTRRLVQEQWRRFPRGLVPVVPGFFGCDPLGRVVTLGRGGSDTTATVLGAALGAERVEIFTDVDGVLSAPPQLVPEAEVVPSLTFDEALAIAAHGGKVLHHKAIAPCQEAGVEIAVRNTFRPHLAGTVIGSWRGPRWRPVCVTGRPWDESDPALALLAVVGQGLESNREAATRARTVLAAAEIPQWGVPSPGFPAACRLAVGRGALAEAVAVLHRALVEGTRGRCAPEATWTATRPPATGAPVEEVWHG